MFVDFCSVTNNKSPTSQLYGVKLENGKVGINAIQVMPQCTVISSAEENIESSWQNVTTFLSDFKCAQVQGGSSFDVFVVRLQISYMRAL